MKIEFNAMSVSPKRRGSTQAHSQHRNSSMEQLFASTETEAEAVLNAISDSVISCNSNIFYTRTVQQN